MQITKKVRERAAYLGVGHLLITLVTTSVFLTVLWGSTLRQITYEKDVAVAAEIQKNSNLAQSHQERAANAFALLDQTLLFLRAEYLSYGLRKTLQAQLQAMQVQQKFVSNVALIGPQGQTLANTAGPPSSNYADREYFKVHANDPSDILLIGTPLLGRITGKWVITLTRRVNRPDGSFGGLVRVTVDAEYFAKDYAKTNLGPHAAMALIGLDGITRARRNGDKISFGEDINKSQLFKELPKAANGHYIAEAASDGVRRIVAYRSLEDYPMVAIVGSSLEDVHALSGQREQVYLGAASLVTLASIFTALLLLMGASRRAELRAKVLDRERRHRQEVEKSHAELGRVSSLLETTGELAQVGGWEVNLASMKLSWTRETFRIAGIEPPNEPPLEEGINLFAPEARPAISAAVQAAMESATPYDLQLPIISADGQRKWVRTQGYGEVHNGKVTRIYGTFQDITVRVRAEEAAQAIAERLSLATRAGGIGIWDWDLVSNRLVWDDAMYALYGVSPDQFDGAYAAWLSGVHPDDRSEAAAVGEAARQGLREYDTEFRVTWPNAEVHNIRALANVQRDSSGVPVRMVGTNWDITRQKSTEKALKDSVKEREALLMEVHHRVKNNLQVITSLLRMETRRSSVPEAVALLKGMQGRVFAMAQLHESLYRSGTFASIDLGVYLGKIASETFKTHLLEGQPVQLQLHMGSVPVGMDQAISCGLLVNELVSNCLKHGLPQGMSGEVRVELQPVNPATVDTDALWRLQISDTGIGLPPDFEDKRKTSLGLQLVGDLSQQARGTLTISSQPGAGASFTIVLKVQPPQALVMPE